MSRQGVISNEMKTFLIPKYANAGTLKGNPKLHKNGVPFISLYIGNGINSPTEKLAEVAEHELNDFVVSSFLHQRHE